MDSRFWIIETKPTTRWVIARPSRTEMSTLMYSKLPMYLYESEKLIHITGFSKKMIFLRPFSFLLQTAFILEKCALKESETQVLQEVGLMVLVAGQFRTAVWILHSIGV